MHITRIYCTRSSVPRVAESIQERPGYHHWVPSSANPTAHAQRVFLATCHLVRGKDFARQLLRRPHAPGAAVGRANRIVVCVPPLEQRGSSKSIIPLLAERFHRRTPRGRRLSAPNHRGNPLFANADVVACARERAMLATTLSDKRPWGGPGRRT